MKKIYFFLIAIFPCVLFAQTSLKNIRQKSYQVFAYKINALAAERYLRQDSIPVDEFLDETPAYIFKKDSVHTDSLPRGLYILISAEEGDVVADMTGITNLVVSPVSNQYNVQLDVRTQDGAVVDDAKVWVNDKEAGYNPDAKTYWLKQKNLSEGLVKIYAPGDTAFVSLDGEDRFEPVWKQRWRNFKIAKTWRFLTYVPKKIASVFRRHSHYKNQNIHAAGYVLFNQPKYKLSDTVKLKAYIVDRKWKRYREKANIFLEYYAKGKSNEQLLTALSPVSPGSYVYSFALNDTLESDNRYRVVFKNKKGEIIISKEFSTEDYLLDEIENYKVRSKNETYYANDTLRFYASAKDANGLPLLDAKATLHVTTYSIDDFYRDSMQVADTLYTEEKALAAEGETVFSFAANNLPNAKLTLKASIIFKNSNNELHEESTFVKYSPKARELSATLEEDSVVATWRVDGNSVAADAVMEVSGDKIDQTMKVKLPARIKANPLADQYTFILNDGKDTIKETVSVDNNYTPSFSRVNREDTVGFILHNPYKIPVSFLVLDGNNLVGTGEDDREEISWNMWTADKKKIYTVKWQYTWGGEQRQGSERIALLYKLLQIKINNQQTVFPGQKDSITIEVKDYKNRPAEGVNLAAVAYNSQFKNDIQVREPPYLVKYKNRPSIIRDTYKADDAYILSRYKLGNYKRWINKLALDTMPFYKILFPKVFPYDVVTPVNDFVPQVSVHIVKKGQPQEVYLLYINRQLFYYNGVTDKMKYAFRCMAGYTQIGIRLFDKYIETDSIYLQPYYKHDIVIDLDSLPAHTILKNTTDQWSHEERNLIENSIWQLDNNYKTDNGYVWQNDRVVKLNGNAHHFAGPFNRGDSLHFFAPGDFDIHFRFEPGYEYDLSTQIARLEKKSIFPANTSKFVLRKYNTPSLILGDTIVSPPKINYPPINTARFIKATPYRYFRFNDELLPGGKIKFTIAKETTLRYVILYNTDTSFTNIVLEQDVHIIRDIKPGIYKLLLVTKEFATAEIQSLQVKANQTLCFNAEAYPFKPGNTIVEDLISKSMKPIEVLMKKSEADKHEFSSPAAQPPAYIFGNSSISGKVIDAKGKNGIAGATVSIKGISYAVSTDANGNFKIEHVKNGTYTLVVSVVGFELKEIKMLVQNENAYTTVPLNMSVQSLNEVVVIGYGVTKRDMTGSVATIRGEELSNSITSNTLRGRVAGLVVSGVPGSGSQIRLRGITGLTNGNKPIYVIDGIIYDELPPNVTPSMTQNAEILQGPAATAIYGERAANGAIVITTGAASGRSKFSDNAIWQPELFTNAEGKVSFEVVYPDNITGWQLFVLGMDKHRRMGKGIGFTKAYKPLLAQLNCPQFLIDGDTVQLIGKALNYTGDDYSVKTKLEAENNVLYSKDTLLPGSTSVIAPVTVTTNGSDTLHATFSLHTTTDFTDAEDRKIPVFKKGSEEATGAFYILQNDTTITFSPMANGAPVEMYAQNNTLDILLSELDHLKKYPYFCMEQIASKLRGLTMERQIRAILNQPFKGEKEMNALIKKLQESRAFDGGWGWWGQDKINLQVTSYIIEALLPHRANPLIEGNIRNGLLYLQFQLPHAKRDEALQLLATMSAANHAFNYKTYLATINYDSLTQHQQWQWVKICQQQKLDYNKQLQQLLNAQTATMTGAVHWGTENYRWFNNTIATTALAFSVLEKENNYRYLLPRIVQYFLEQRQKGFWRNTVESASVTAAILPYVIENNKTFNAPSAIHVSGDTSFDINSFPASAKMPAYSKQITVNKTGGGITYLTLYQKWWNERPEPVTDKFDIDTYFEKNGQQVSQISAGEKVSMIARVNVHSDAGFVMIEIPIPAGCNYANKMQDGSMHKEFYKNKVVLFSEALNKGVHVFKIDLESRYKGTFTLNPASAALMYFPTMFGRNGMRHVTVQ